MSTENRRGIGLCQYKLTMSLKSSQLKCSENLDVSRASEGRVDSLVNMEPWLAIMGRPFEQDTPGNETDTTHHLKVIRRTPVGILVFKILVFV